MKKLITLVLALCMILSCTIMFASCGDKNENSKQILNVYTNAGFAPYEYLDSNGNVVGVDIDIVKYIGEKLGYEVVINDIDFDLILNEVQNDKFAVGAAGMSKKESRDAVALASNVYATSQQYVIAPKGTFNDGAVVTMAEVVAYAESQTSKSIGDQKGTTGASLVEESVEGSNANAVEYSNAIIASGDIGTAVAAVVIDKLPAESICNNNSKLQCWKLDAEMESYVMYFNKENAELVTKVNEILAEMISSGKIDEYTVNHSTGK